LRVKLPKTKGVRSKKKLQSHRKRTNPIRIAWWAFIVVRRFMGRTQNLSSNIIRRLTGLHYRQAVSEKFLKHEKSINLVETKHTNVSHTLHNYIIKV